MRSAEQARAASARGSRTLGPDRVLTAAYALFVVAAGGRSAVQLGTHAGRAPLAYTLSAVAALGYAVGLVLLGRAARGAGRRLAAAWCGVEFAGVLAVGTWSVVAPESFPDATVWSRFGAGYLFVPLALPLVALLWIRRTASAR